MGEVKGGKDPVDLQAMATGEVQQAVSVTDLISMCNVAVRGMGANNPNRWLLYNCGYAMRQMVDRVAKLEEDLHMVNTRIQ